MKRYIKIVSTLIAFFLFIGSPVVSQADAGGFRDISGHWAEATLIQACDDGILVGDGDYLLPDANISAAQVLTILCRVLGAEKQENISGWGLSESEWYYEYIAKAAYMDLISSADAKNLSAPISRQNAFYLLAEAFSLIEAKPDMSVLERFADSGLIVDTRRQAMASLVSQGLLNGSYGKLHVNSYTTRAEFMSVLYRIVGEYLPASDADGKYESGVVLQGSAELNGNSFSNGVWFTCAASDISLESVRAKKVGIRSHKLSSLIIGGSSRIENLALASQTGNITVSPADGATVGTLTVGAGRGRVTVKGIGTIEVTGSLRHIIISGDAERVVVSGRGNTIEVSDGASVGEIELLKSAPDCRLVVDGNVEDIRISGMRASVKGKGYAETLTISADYPRIDLSHGNLINNIDWGITGASVRMNLPDKLPAGDTLNVSAVVEHGPPGKICDLVWYINDVPIVEAKIDAGGELPKLTHTFTYSRTMRESADVRISIKYLTTNGDIQEISSKGTVKLENYSKQHWMSIDAPAVLGKVSTYYQGDFTLDWALANDLSDYEKEVWVNAKGYKSDSEYLLWVSIEYQRLNIYEGSAGNWELKKSCLIGTGAIGSMTKRGVTTVTSKQVNGWTTSTYTVKPVVRFWPGSGYAFHSRLYYPKTDTLRDTRIGFPISHGCVRMYDEDAWYLYDSIPSGTTVVIF